MRTEGDGDGVVVAFGAQLSSSLDMDCHGMLIKLINATKEIEHSYGPTAVHAAQHPRGYLHKVAGIKKYKPNILALAHKSTLLEVIDHRYINIQIYKYTNITIYENM